jgi:SAM-dependent methyltransferase
VTHWTDRLFREQGDIFAETFAERFDAAEAEVDDLLALLADEYDHRPDRTLDVACGVGRHVIALADRGCHAEGLDFSAEYVERARDRAADRGLDDRTAFHHADMRDLAEWGADRGPYDLVTILWNSLGYYDRATDEAVLAAVRDLLADDAPLVVEMGNKDFYLADDQPAAVNEESGRLTVDQRTYDVETGRFHTTAHWFDATDDGYEYLDTLEWEQRMYAPVVLRELCLDAGFESVDLYADFDGRDLRRESPTVVVVAR